MIGIGLPCAVAAKSRSLRRSCGFFVYGPFYGGPNVGPQGRLQTASAAAQVVQPVRAAAPIGLGTAVLQLLLLEAIMDKSSLSFSGERAKTTPFNFGTHAVRIVMCGDTPWFVATDVCAALDYKNSRKAVADHLDDDERCNQSLHRGGTQTLINESGLYALVLRSRKPEARKFAKWVTGEVLPSIRKTGSYQAQPFASEQIAAATDAAAQVFAAVLKSGADWKYHHHRICFVTDSTKAAPAMVFTTHERDETINATVNKLARQLLHPNGYPVDVFIPLWEAVNTRLTGRTL